MEFELLMSLIFDKSIQERLLNKCEGIAITLYTNPCENCQEFSCDGCKYKEDK